MKNTISLAGRAALLFCLALLSAHAFADRDDNEISRFIQSQDNNPGPGIGKTLPEDLVVLNSAGEEVVLRDVLQAPVALIKTLDGCPPCDTLVNYAKSHANAFRDEQGMRIAVLLIASETAHESASGDDSGTLWLHSPEFFLEGILGGTDLPAVYFFDQDFRLAGLRTGLFEGSNEAMAATLTFPDKKAGGNE